MPISRTLFLGVVLCMLFVNIVAAQVSTASQLWITLRGCYNYKGENGSIILLNEPQVCFRSCPNSMAVGLKDTTCICYQSYTFSGLSRDHRCNMKCPGKSQLYCGGGVGSSSLVNVYSRDTPPTNDINESTDYGFVYVNISSSQSTYHASNNDPTLKYDYRCYDDILGQYPCSPLNQETTQTWVEAMNMCHKGGLILITVSLIPSCLRPPVGIFWVGMYRDNPGSATSETTTLISASTSTFKTASISPSTRTTPSTPTTVLRQGHNLTSRTPTTVSTPGHNWTSTATGHTSEGSSSDGINVVYVAVPVFAVVGTILAVLFSLLTCWKRNIACFKPRQNRVNSEERESRQEQHDRMEEEERIDMDLNHNGTSGQQDTQNGEPLGQVNSNNAPRLNAENNSIAPERDQGINKIGSHKPGISDEAEIAKQSRNAEIQFENQSSDIGIEPGGSHGKTYERIQEAGRRNNERMGKNEKRHKIEGSDNENEEIEDTEDHFRNSDMKTSINPGHSDAANEEREPKSRRKRKREKSKDKKNRHKEGSAGENEGIEDNTGGHVRNSNRKTEDHLGATSTNPLLPHAENEERHQESRRKRLKEKRKDKKKIHKEGSAGENEGLEDNTGGHVRNLDRKTEDHLGATSTNPLLPHAENEERHQESRRKRKKEKRKDKKKRHKEGSAGENEGIEDNTGGHVRNSNRKTEGHLGAITENKDRQEDRRKHKKKKKRRDKKKSHKEGFDDDKKNEENSESSCRTF